MHRPAQRRVMKILAVLAALLATCTAEAALAPKTSSPAPSRASGAAPTHGACCLNKSDEPQMSLAINLNTSLLSLANMMKAPSTQAPHVPYRDSKLTHMLSDALGGHASLAVGASRLHSATGVLYYGGALIALLLASAHLLLLATVPAGRRPRSSASKKTMSSHLMASRRQLPMTLLLALIPLALSDGTCGEAKRVFPRFQTDNEITVQEMLNPHSQRCLSSSSRMEMSMLQRIYRNMLVRARGGANPRMLAKDWEHSLLNAAIARILITEVLDYPPPDVCTTPKGTTAKSFDFLSTGTADMDMELWAASAYDEYIARLEPRPENEEDEDAPPVPEYVHAGRTFTYGRSGLFIRPGGTAAQRAEILTNGRTYSNLERDVLPLLPTLAQVRQQLPDLWCNSQPTSEHCIEMPNRACYDLGSGSNFGECRVLLKTYDSFDPTIVEEMIANASLPLVIVYTGDISFLDTLPDQTFLFHLWEPHFIIRPGTDIMRVAFESPVMCDVNESFTDLPTKRACDFREGQVHKGYSRRISSEYSDIGYLIDKFRISSADILEMEMKIRADESMGGTGNGTYPSSNTSQQLGKSAAVRAEQIRAATHRFSVACDWVREHDSTWQRWIEPRAKRQSTPLIVFFTCAAVLALTWIMVPYMLDNTQHFAWFNSAAWCRPAELIRALRALLACRFRQAGRGYAGCLAKAAVDAKHLATSKWATLKSAFQLETGGPKTNVAASVSRKPPAPKATSIRESPVLAAASMWKRWRRRKPPADAIDGCTASTIGETVQSATHIADGSRPKLLQFDAMSESSKSLPHSKTLARVLVHSSEYEGKFYTARQHAFAAFVQRYVRSESLRDARAAKARVLERRRRDGVQFMQREVFGLQGDAHFKISLVRGKALASEPCMIDIVVNESTAHEGIDFRLASRTAKFKKGSRMLEIDVELLNNGISMKGDASLSWRPIREATISISLTESGTGAYQDNTSVLGDVTECRLNIVDNNKWPVEMKSVDDIRVSYGSIFWSYVKQVLKENIQGELWWLLRIVIEALCSRVVVNILNSYLLLDLVIARNDLDMAFFVAAGHLCVELIYHVTSYWYNSSWMIGYNCQVTSLLAKWSEMPFSRLVDGDTIAEYRSMVDLMTSGFFAQHDYSAAANMIKMWIELVVIVFAPLILLNLETTPDSWFPLALKNIYHNPLSWSTSAGLLALVIVFYFMDTVTPNVFEVEVCRWMRMQKDFVNRLESQFIDGPLVRYFRRKHVSELQRTTDSMALARDQMFVYYMAIDQNGRHFEWSLILFYVIVIVAAPLIRGIGGLSPGAVLSFLTIISGARTQITKISTVREQVQVGEFILSQLADLLNSDRELLILRTEHSRRQRLALTRAVQDLDMDHAAIMLYQVRHVADMLHDAHGNKLSVQLEGQLPTGVLLGLSSPSRSSHENSIEREHVHQMIIDLIGGIDTPFDGAIAIAPHLTLAVVPQVARFKEDRSLLENLRYGCDGIEAAKQPEHIVWHVCSVLGLPSYLCNSKGGQLVMGTIALCEFHM